MRTLKVSLAEFSGEDHLSIVLKELRGEVGLVFDHIQSGNSRWRAYWSWALGTRWQNQRTRYRKRSEGRAEVAAEEEQMQIAQRQEQLQLMKQMTIIWTSTDSPLETASGLYLVSELEGSLNNLINYDMIYWSCYAGSGRIGGEGSERQGAWVKTMDDGNKK